MSPAPRRTTRTSTPAPIGPQAGDTGPQSASGALVLTVPMPEITTNRRHGKSRHWRVLHAEKVAYWDQLDLVAHVSRVRPGPLDHGHGLYVPPVPPAPLAAVWLSAEYVLGGAMDDDNAAARAKPLIDWLVKRGYLASDRRTCVRWASFPAQRVTRKEPARITLTLTPRAP